MTNNEKLFEKLKREGECWHEWEDYGTYIICKHCENGQQLTGVYVDEDKSNPDFTTPDGFFWLIERAKEAEWWGKFISWLREKYVPYDIYMLLTSPTALRDALYEYFNIGGE